MVRAETAIAVPFELEADEPQAEGAGDTDAEFAGRKIEDWIVSTLGDQGSSTPGDEWAELLGRIAPGTMRRKTPERAAGPADARGRWARFRLSRRKGITVVGLTDRALIKEPELSELAGDLLALVEAGHQRLVINFMAVERLSSWAVGAVAEALRICAATRHGALKVCGLREDLAGIFKLAGLARAVERYPDENAAIDSPWPDAPEFLPLPVSVLSALTRVGDEAAPECIGPRLAVDTDPDPDPVPEAVPPEEDHPPMSGVWLIAEVGPSKGRSIAVTAPLFMIGRDAGCQLRPGSTAVSRSHAQIERRGEQLVLRDLGSTNGTLLNGRRLKREESALKDGDRIEIGPLGFTLALTAAGAEPPGIEDLVTNWLRDQGYDERTQGVDSSATEDFPIPEGLDTAVPVKYEVIQDVMVVTPLFADLDGDRAIGRLREELTALFDRPLPRRVVVNLTHVGHLSGRAIGVLVAHHLKLDRAGGSLRVCQAHARVAAVLEQVQLAMLVECHPTLDDAVLSGWPRVSEGAGYSAV